MPKTRVVSQETWSPKPSGVVILWASLDLNWESLSEDEQQLIVEASPLRRRQTATGRRLAREAIARLGVASSPSIPADHNGVPIWPDGIRGSISHTTELCAVAVAKVNALSCLGVDIETNEANFSENEWDLVSSSEERLAASYCQNLSMHQFVNLIFSSKEAAYKSLYIWMRGQRIDFSDFHCQLQPDAHSFEISVQIASQTIPRSLFVNWVPLSDHILTFAWQA